MTYISKQPAFGILKSYLEYEDLGVFDPSSYASLAQPQSVDAASAVLDLGCGAGNSIDLFHKKAPSAIWYGVDIVDSPEVRTRTRNDGNFATFDGINLPYNDAFFDLVYSNQVFEHVRHPEPLLREVVRVLKPGGSFVGALSYLEPYHSFSIFNITPYGLVTILKEVGFKVIELRAGSDTFSLIFRQLIGKPNWSNVFLRRSLYYFLVDFGANVTGFSVEERNYMKIQFCGHLCFKAQRTE